MVGIPCPNKQRIHTPALPSPKWRIYTCCTMSVIASLSAYSRVLVSTAGVLRPARSLTSDFLWGPLSRAPLKPLYSYRHHPWHVVHPPLHWSQFLCVTRFSARLWYHTHAGTYGDIAAQRRHSGPQPPTTTYHHHPATIPPPPYQPQPPTPITNDKYRKK